MVVDTGSVDDTVAIARGAGATVESIPWTGDFATARNHALGLARGEWILYIDADERLSVTGDLRGALQDGRDVVAGLVRFRPALRYTRFLEYRFFRNRPDIRFRGVIHETMLPDITRIVAVEGARVIEVPAQIEHFGYEGDLTRKHHRNRPLLLRQSEADPGRIYLWLALGLAHSGLGDGPAAEVAWERGVDVSRQSGEMSRVALAVYVELILCRIRDGRSAHQLVTEVVSHFTDSPLIPFVVAQQALADRRWADAVPMLEEMAAIDAADLIDALAYDERLFTEFPANALGVCWFHLGDHAAAAHWFARAEAAAPGVEEYVRKRQLAEAKATPGECRPSR